MDIKYGGPLENKMKIQYINNSNIKMYTNKLLLNRQINGHF